MYILKSKRRMLTYTCHFQSHSATHTHTTITIYICFTPLNKFDSVLFKSHNHMSKKIYKNRKMQKVSVLRYRVKHHANTIC